MGPFRIVERVGPVAYRLESVFHVCDVMRAFHKVFHVSMLRKCLHKADEVLAKIPKGSSAQHDFGGETSEGSREEVQGTSVKEDSFDQSLV